MTLASRNKVFISGIAAGIISLAIVAGAALFILPAFTEAHGLSIQRSQGILQRFLMNITEASPNITFIAITAAVIYSLAGIFLLFYFFEKTQTPEILFVGIFIISFAFECIRIMIPLNMVMDITGIYLTTGSRVLFFGRYLGLFSLFAASTLSAGLEAQKQQNIIFISATASVIFAIGVPIDGLAWDTSLVLLNDYSSTFNMVQAGIYVITILSFLISAYTRGSRDYLSIALGAFLMLMGRNMLLNSDTLFSFIPGFIMLSFGTWLMCSKFHRIYMWL